MCVYVTEIFRFLMSAGVAQFVPAPNRMLSGKLIGTIPSAEWQVVASILAK